MPKYMVKTHKVQNDKFYSIMNTHTGIPVYVEMVYGPKPAVCRNVWYFDDKQQAQHNADILNRGQ